MGALALPGIESEEGSLRKDKALSILHGIRRSSAYLAFEILKKTSADGRYKQILSEFSLLNQALLGTGTDDLATCALHFFIIYKIYFKLKSKKRFRIEINKIEYHFTSAELKLKDNKKERSASD